jgi:hypothetical protein
MYYLRRVATRGMQVSIQGGQELASSNVSTETQRLWEAASKCTHRASRIVFLRFLS